MASEVAKKANRQERLIIPSKIKETLKSQKKNFEREHWLHEVGQTRRVGGEPRSSGLDFSLLRTPG